MKPIPLMEAIYSLELQRASRLQDMADLMMRCCGKKWRPRASFPDIDPIQLPRSGNYKPGTNTDEEPSSHFFHHPSTNQQIPHFSLQSQFSYNPGRSYNLTSLQKATITHTFHTLTSDKVRPPHPRSRSWHALLPSTGKPTNLFPLPLTFHLMM